MPGDDPYQTMGGGLKLKGVSAGKKKKKKKSKKIVDAAAASAAAAKAAKMERGEKLKAEYDDTRTETQKKFDEIQRQREMKRIKEKASLTHKEKVDALNNYLSTLSEHYDVPKVSWTK